MLANRLKILIAERDLTIKDLVKATNLSRTSISNMVNNPYANISTENVDLLCNYLEITPKDFWDYSSWNYWFGFGFTKSYYVYHNYENEPLYVIATLKGELKNGKKRRPVNLCYAIFNLAELIENDELSTNTIKIYISPDWDSDSYVNTNVDPLSVIYKKLSPLFKHQIENAIMDPLNIFDILKKAEKDSLHEGVINDDCNIVIQYNGDESDENPDFLFEDSFSYAELKSKRNKLAHEI